MADSTVTLTPSGKVGVAFFGCSMALSADGMTAVVGGYGDNNQTGAAWVFVRSAGNWVQQAKLVGDAVAGSGFGASVALSADSYTLLIGGFGGAAWIFSRSDDGNSWQQDLKLTGLGGFGSSVALSYDGNVALIGARSDNQTGAAWVYTRSGEVWSQQVTKLAPSDSTVTNFGQSVALSADGDVALVGASGRGNDEGSAWVFSSTDGPSTPATVWTLPGVRLPARSDGANTIGFGTSVALSADGDVALVSCFGNDQTQTGAWVFSNDDGWKQQSPRLMPSPTGIPRPPMAYGQSVALSADGLSALVSDYSASLASAWLFKYDGNAWSLWPDMLAGQGSRAPGFRFGTGSSVAMSAAGKTYLACSYDGTYDGQPFVFDEGGWVLTHIFVLMLENHSFDCLFGLSGIPKITTSASTRSNTFTSNNQSKTYPVSKPALASMHTDPGHEFADIMEQLCGSAAQQHWVNGQPYPTSITGEGFVSNYATSRSEIKPGDPGPTPEQYGDIMKCFDTPAQLPVIYRLATEFALCDQWFASLPGPTFPNRAFLHGGSSSGLADSPADTTAPQWAVHGFEHAHGNIFAALRGKGIVWQIFVDRDSILKHLPPPVCLLKGIHLLNTSSFETFDTSVNSPTYPQGYTFIEPNYGDVFGKTFKNGTSQHPMDGTYGGELLIKRTYESIRNSPHWPTSLLIITYDEHGGFFDSATPGPAPAPKDNPSNDKRFDYSQLTKFDFTQLGVRVPAVVVSPRVQKGTVDHTLYDHTSVLATIEHFFAIPALTERDGKANPLTPLVSGPFRDDCPTVLPDPVPPPSGQLGVAFSSVVAESDPLVNQQPLPVSGTVHGFLAALLKTDLELTPSEATRAKILAEYELIRTEGDARAYAEKVNAKIESMQRPDKPLVDYVE